MISRYESTIGADDAWETNEEQSEEDTASRLGAGAEANAEAEAVHGSKGWRCAGPKEEIMNPCHREYCQGYLIWDGRRWRCTVCH